MQQKPRVTLTNLEWDQSKWNQSAIESKQCA